jgi:hypothetical protein
LPTRTGTPIVIPSDGELMGNDGIPSIKYTTKNHYIPIMCRWPPTSKND